MPSGRIWEVEGVNLLTRWDMAWAQDIYEPKTFIEWLENDFTHAPFLSVPLLGSGRTLKLCLLQSTLVFQLIVIFFSYLLFHFLCAFPLSRRCFRFKCVFSNDEFKYPFRARLTLFPAIGGDRKFLGDLVPGCLSG